MGGNRPLGASELHPPIRDLHRGAPPGAQAPGIPGHHFRRAPPASLHDGWQLGAEADRIADRAQVTVAERADNIARRRAGGAINLHRQRTPLPAATRTKMSAHANAR